MVAVKKNTDGTYILTTKVSGDHLECYAQLDHVVIAAPFTSLRANVDLSKAGLSPLKMTAINSLGMTVGWQGHGAVQRASLVPTTTTTYVLGDTPYELVVGSKLKDEQQHGTNVHPDPTT